MKTSLRHESFSIYKMKSNIPLCCCLNVFCIVLFTLMYSVRDCDIKMELYMVITAPRMQGHCQLYFRQH